MFIYLFVFFISIISTVCAEHNLRLHRRGAFYFFSVIAILVPAMLAGFRDKGIGTDTLYYVDNVWHDAQYIHSWKDFIKSYLWYNVNDIEFVYLLLNYLTSFIGTQVNWIYFTTNLIVVGLVYGLAYDNRKQTSMWLIMTLFFFLFYNTTLNMVRQSIALAMCAYSYKYLEQKKWLPLLIWLILIIYTHNTGFFYLAVVVVRFIFQIPNKLLSRFLQASYLLSITILLVFLDDILALSIAWGMLPERYIAYSTLENNNGTMIIKSLLITHVIFYLTLIISKNEYKKTSLIIDELSCYSYLKLTGIILFLSSLTFFDFLMYM